MLRPGLRRALLAFLGGAALVGAAVSVSAAGRQAGAPVLLKGDLYGNIPNVTIRGVKAGGAPWVVVGSVVLTPSTLTASGSWLVVPSGVLASGKPVPKAMVGTTVGVKSVVAAVSCANSTALVVTAPAPLSAQGQFKIAAKVATPKGCVDPIVLVGPSNGKGGIAAWFASTDFLTDYGVATPAMIKAFEAASKTAKGSGSTATATTSTGSSGSTWA